MQNNTVWKMQKEIIAEFKRLDAGKSGYFNLSSYLGTQNKLYHLKNAQERKIAKEFLSRHRDITKEQFLELLNALYKGESFNERHFGTYLLAYKKPFKHLFTPARVFDWLNNLSGWCEVDGLCQSTFTAEDLLGDWRNWEKTLDKMSRSPSSPHHPLRHCSPVRHCELREAIPSPSSSLPAQAGGASSRRRASLVLLVKSVRGSNDVRLADLAFKNLDRLKGEKDILISKAVSWLLRSLIKYHKDRVSSFLADNKDILPKFVIKEVSNKLSFGTKSRR